MINVIIPIYRVESDLEKCIESVGNHMKQLGNLTIHGDYAIFRDKIKMEILGI